MDNPRTDAHALHDLLEQLQSSSEASIWAGWAKVFECQRNTAEFARRHSEVVRLLSNTLAHIEALDEVTKNRNMRYAHAWWAMIVGPERQWATNTDLKQVVNQNHLDQLGNLADILAARSARAPGSSELALERLREECEAWIEHIADFPELPAALRQNLIHDLGHVVWLISNVDLFGPATVVSTAQQAMGGVYVATARVPSERRGSWQERAFRLAGTLGIVAGVLQGADFVLESGQDLANTFAELVVAPEDTDALR